MAGDVDGDDFLEAEIPLQFGDNKGSDETTAGSVDVDGDVNVLGDEQVVDGLGVLVATSVSGAENGHNTNGVLVDEVNSFLRVDQETITLAEDVLFVNLKVTNSLLPADLDGRRHDQVGVLGALALGLATELPATLHGQHSKHDGLGRSDGGGAHG